VNTSSNSCDN